MSQQELIINTTKELLVGLMQAKSSAYPVSAETLGEEFIILSQKVSEAHKKAAPPPFKGSLRV